MTAVHKEVARQHLHQCAPAKNTVNMGDIDGLYIEGEYQYEGLTMGKTVPREQLDKLKGFKFREDDILMPSYLKAGNVIIFMKTFTQKLCEQR